MLCYQLSIPIQAAEIKWEAVINYLTMPEKIYYNNDNIGLFICYMHYITINNNIVYLRL